ncbi:MAG TPA: 3',5'-cyclic-nucleotide phosphodiesterase [Thermoanaerobaculaceae bacterium]|nr:3',5'-cyclic-nucleotide phosphodiesterase [Thermoanaerobaculaceae bacterium]HPS77605.1 3',5'-cyclic-nucleotide phosphodiesterase [Thermoanaerobaculaceae bacterium]
MEWRILGSFGGSSPTCRMTSFLINGHLALDAGSITQALTLPEQRQIDRVVVTHSHLDHTASIPFLVENTFSENHGGLEILVTPQVMQTVKLHLFNNDTWPDFTRIPNDFLPALRLRQIEPRQRVAIDGLHLTPIPVHHIVPTHGYVVEDADGAVIFTSDTGPTEEIWEVANRTAGLKALIVEVSFPSRLQAVADVSLHLTPTTLAAELAKLRRDIPVYLYHLKPSCLEELREELAATRFPHRVEELRQDDVYCF